MTDSATDFTLDPDCVRRHFSEAAATINGADFLAREVSSRMAERLDYIRLDPRNILDLGCGHGPDLAMLAARFPKSVRTGLDCALPLLREARPERTLGQRILGRNQPPMLVCADASQLPVASSRIDLLWSNLLLNWLTDPMPAFAEMHRVMAVGGLLMFATLGPDSLRELRSAMSGMQGEHVHRFIDMHDIGDCLVRTGFSDPVMDMQMLTLTYPDVDSLFSDLRHSGCSNAAGHRARGLTGRRGWNNARRALEQTATGGEIPVSIELIFGHAWKAAPTHLADGRAIIEFRPREPSR